MTGRLIALNRIVARFSSRHQLKFSAQMASGLFSDPVLFARTFLANGPPGVEAPPTFNTRRFGNPCVYDNATCPWAARDSKSEWHPLFGEELERRSGAKKDELPSFQQEFRPMSPQFTQDQGWEKHSLFFRLRR